MVGLGQCSPACSRPPLDLARSGAEEERQIEDGGVEDRAGGGRQREQGSRPSCARASYGSQVAEVDLKRCRGTRGDGLARPAGG